MARGVGKAVVNSPLFKVQPAPPTLPQCAAGAYGCGQCAIAGNDPNVGRLASSIGDYMGAAHPGVSLQDCQIRMAGRCEPAQAPRTAHPPHPPHRLVRYRPTRHLRDGRRHRHS